MPFEQVFRNDLVPAARQGRAVVFLFRIRRGKHDLSRLYFQSSEFIDDLVRAARVVPVFVVYVSGKRIDIFARLRLLLRKLGGNRIPLFKAAAD